MNSLRLFLIALLTTSLSLLCYPSLYGQVTGSAFLSGQTDHSGISVIFSSTSTSGQSDTTYTLSNGSYSINLNAGVYFVRMEASNYQTVFYNQNQSVLLNGNDLLDPVTLPVGVVKYINGALSGTLYNDTIYIANADISVPAGSSLVIEAGTEIRLEPNLEFFVDGSLQAAGTAVDSIKFTIQSINPGDTWAGITFSDLSVASFMDYCVVEHGETAIDVFETFAPLSSALGLTVSNSTVRYCVYGIILNSEHRVKVHKNDVYGFKTTGIGFYSANVNQPGPYDITCNKVHDASNSGFLYGLVTFLSAPNAYVAGNEVYNLPSGIGIRLGRDGGEVTVENNVIRNCAQGIGESASNNAPSAVIRNNIIQDNAFGISMSGEGGAIVQMNVVTGNEIGINQFNPQYGTPAELSYNLISLNDTNYSSAVNVPFAGDLITVNANGDSTDAYFNLDQDPLIDSNYFQLVGSPLLDAGDPSLTDADGSIRDIGLSPDPQSCWSPPALPLLVYPGDVNYDQVANVWDVLPIGVAFGQTGPSRPNASLNWTGQTSLGWGDSLASGLDIKHADCDGNGIIDANDTLAIIQNYQSTHTALGPKNSTNGIPLYMDMPSSQSPGDTLSIPIMLGTVDSVTSNLYGLAFSIDYDSSLIEPNSLHLQFANSWIGADDQDMLSLFHDDFNQSKVEVGIVRTDGIEVSGYGQIATIIVVLDDDIAKRSIPFEMQWAEVDLIHYDESPIEVSPVDGTAEVDTSSNTTTTGIDQDPILTSFQVYPNPVEQNLNIKLDGLRSDATVQLLDFAGRVQRMERLMASRQQSSLDVSDLPSGMYLLQVRLSDQRVLHRKIRVK